jgi:uncharacterized Zn finger protein (UPF0148 family)
VICLECGEVLEESAVLCPNCGAENTVSTKSAEPTEAPSDSEISEPTSPADETEDKSPSSAGSKKWKALAIGAAVIVALIIVGVVIGLTLSSGNTRQAKTYLKAADAAFDTLNNNLVKLQSSLTAALAQALSGNYSTVSANIWLYSNDVQRNKALQELGRVGAMYRKVQSLKDAADYKAYANAMLTVISTNAQLLNQGKLLLETLLNIAGNQAAVREFFNTKTMIITLLQNASNTATKAEDNARKIKEDKNLIW